MKEYYIKAIIELLVKVKLDNYDNILNKITDKTLFGGFGIFYEKIIFARLCNNDLYLRLQDNCLKIIDNFEMTPLILEQVPARKTSNYYKVTDKLLKNSDKLAELLHQVILESLEERYQKDIAVHSRIRDLPNIRAWLERDLLKIGIKDVETFLESNIYDIYFRLQKIKPNISEKVLFKLFGAAMRVHVETISAQKCDDIRKKYQAFLSEKSYENIDKI